jgi:hypothetical protein
MYDAPHTEDLGLSAVRTRADLAALLRIVHMRADRPSLRTLEARTRHSPTPLSKTVVAEMLRGVRFPRKAVMVSFILACGLADDATEPWQRAWERVAVSEEGLARPIDGTEEMEIQRLRDQVSRLTMDNAELRTQLTRRPDIPSVQISPVRDLAATIFMASQDHAVRYFAMDDDKSARLFYADLAKYIQNAKETVYILGKGFHHERSSSVFKLLVRAEKEALRRGVDIIRIQTGNPVAASWAKSYAQILVDFPGQFRMVADVDGASINDVILIDPRGHDPVVSFMFETREPGSLGSVGRPIVALFIINAEKLASNLADQLISHAEELLPLNPQAVRDLASTYIYFAWGVHMASSKIRRDVPDARPLGKAALYGWQRHIKGMLAGPADRATIEQTGKREDTFDGVAYELSWWGKAKIDRLERRAYSERGVEIELNGQVYQAFTYVPLPAVQEKTQLAHGSWIDLVVEGARENDITDLLAELRDSGAHINYRGY